MPKFIHQLLITTTICCALLLSGHSAAREIQLPDLGSSADAIVSMQDERDYAELLIRELHRLAEVVDDPMIDGYMKDMGFSLVAYSDKPSSDFHFFVLDANSVNAFAAPGGVIAVHSALILLADDESELAGVVAHEIAHVTQRHLVRAIESSKRLELPLLLAMLGVALAGAGGDAIQAAVLGSQGIAQQARINFTRSNEQEADRVGIRVLANAGYSPEGMATFFEKMGRISRNYGNGIPEFLRTHPVETKRIAEAKQRAGNQVISDHATRDKDYFHIIKERLRVMTAQSEESVLAYYEGRVSQGTQTPFDMYGKALAHLKLGETIQAYASLNQIPEPVRSTIPLKILEAELDHRAGEYQRSADLFEAMISMHPEHLVISSSYASTLLQDADEETGRRAEALLRPLISRYSSQPSLFLLYSRAAEASGMSTRAGEAFAQYTLLMGQVYDASKQLEELLKDNDLSYYQRSRIEAKLDQVRVQLARIERERGYDPSEGKHSPLTRVSAVQR